MSIRSYFNQRGDLLDLEGWLSTCLPMQVIILANNAVEKAIMDKGHGNEYNKYLIFIMSSMQQALLYSLHAALSLELLEWSCHMHVLEILVLKIFCVARPLLWYFLTQQLITWKIATRIFSDLQYQLTKVVFCFSMVSWMFLVQCSYSLANN